MVSKEEPRKNQNLIVTFRVFQAIFFGLFALGISSIGGDITSYAKIPISVFSMTYSHTLKGRVS